MGGDGAEWCADDGGIVGPPVFVDDAEVSGSAIASDADRVGAEVKRGDAI